MTIDEKKLLESEIQLLKKSVHMLQHSYNNCLKIGDKAEYTLDELETFEALTSRFARTSDILIQKIFRLIDQIELEFEGSIIDRLNRAEKRGLIPSADRFKSMRRLRNQVAHEYVPEAVEEIFKQVMDYTPEVLGVVVRIEQYAEKLAD